MKYYRLEILETDTNRTISGAVSMILGLLGMHIGINPDDREFMTVVDIKLRSDPYVVNLAIPLVSATYYPVPKIYGENRGEHYCFFMSKYFYEDVLGKLRFLIRVMKEQFGAKYRLVCRTCEFDDDAIEYRDECQIVVSAEEYRGKAQSNTLEPVEEILAELEKDMTEMCLA